MYIKVDQRKHGRFENTKVRSRNILFSKSKIKIVSTQRRALRTGHCNVYDKEADPSDKPSIRSPRPA